MSREFKIIKNYYEEEEILYNKSRIKLNTGITVLVGCNGCGKTTLIRQIKDKLDKKNIRYIHFNNLKDGGENARSKAGFKGDFKFLATALTSSEGENISLNIGKIAQKIGSEIMNIEDEYWILLDAVDSGLSIDNIIEIKDLFELIFETNKNKDIYIIISANEYELARGEQCFDVYNCKYITFKDYEDYREFIIKSGEIKQKRYKKNND